MVPVPNDYTFNSFHTNLAIWKIGERKSLIFSGIFSRQLGWYGTVVAT